MPRHGDCKHYVPEGANMCASEGLCMAHMDEMGMPDIVNLYDDIGDCKDYEALERVRTDHAEFAYGLDVRGVKGFEEK